MRILKIILLLIVSSSSYGATLNISGNVTDLSNAPIDSHWVYISVSDSINMFQSTDSVQTNIQGDYSFSISDPAISQYANATITVIDCNSTMHTLLTYMPGGIGYDFQICNGVSPSCQAQFMYFVDSLNTNTYHFVNQSTNNISNTWSVNGIVVSQQLDFTYTFSSPSVDTVCLQIIGNMNCADTACAIIVMDTCSTSFTSIVNGMTVDFVPFNNGVVDYYFWDFGDGNVQMSLASLVSHTYSNNGNYNVVLTSYTVSGQDTCVAVYSDFVLIGQPYPMGNIYGYVFAGSDYLDIGEIFLYAKNPINGNLTLVESTVLIPDSNNVSTYFIFDNIAYGNYYIKCIIPQSSNEYGKYFNTWASQNPNFQEISWENAEVLELSSTLQLAYINLKVPDVFISKGSSEISGSIINNMGIDVSEQVLYLMNYNKNLIGCIQPNSTGDFSFDSLVYGTYYIRPELININTLDIEVLLNANTPSVGNIEIQLDSNSYSTSIRRDENLITFDVYPNPVNEKLNLYISGLQGNEIIIDIYNTLGINIYSKKMVLHGDYNCNIDFYNNEPGLYIITLSDGYEIYSKKILKK